MRIRRIRRIENVDFPIFFLKIIWLKACCFTCERTANPGAFVSPVFARGKNQMVDALRQLEIAQQPSDQRDEDPAAQSTGTARTRPGRVLLTDKALKAMRPTPAKKRLIVWDAVQPHFGVRITDKGHKSFVVVKRVRGTKSPSFYVLGHYPDLKLAEAREKARAVLGELAEGIDRKALERKRQEEERRIEKNRFAAVAQLFIDKHANKIRSGKETARIIHLYLIPTFGVLQIDEIRRRQIAELLDDIEAGNFVDASGRKLGGPVMADRVLAALRKMFNWHAARDDDFMSPIVKGMARTKPRERARTRVLDDYELLALWRALARLEYTNYGPLYESRFFASIVRQLLLTAQRRNEVGRLRGEEIDDEGIWLISAKRYKTKTDHLVPLSQWSCSLLEQQIQLGVGGFAFTTTGDTPFSGYSKSKARLDELMGEELTKIAGSDEGCRHIKLKPWRLHDLRRTAKTLMVRAGVRPDISERVLGHVIHGVEGVYDRHDYVAEKHSALEALSSLVQEIVGINAR
jgi:integrase